MVCLKNQKTCSSILICGYSRHYSTIRMPAGLVLSVLLVEFDVSLSSVSYILGMLRVIVLPPEADFDTNIKNIHRLGSVTFLMKGSCKNV